MLQKLSVQNYALIEKLDLALSPSLNIITGETGAGKSILLGALGLLLGNRCDASALKDREKNCIVEGIFNIEGYDLEAFFTDNDLDYDTTAIVRRVISPAGKSRCYINDLPVQQITLREFGSYLIDIHSQHQNLLLAEDGFRTGVVDGVAGHRELLKKYTDTYHALRLAERELEKLRQDAANSGKDAEWLQFQVEQLAAANLREGEQEELEAERDELAHSGEIGAALMLAADMLDVEETGVLAQLKSAEQSLSRVSDFYARGEEFAGRIRSSIVELRDVQAELASEGGRIESDPARLQTVEERLDTIYSLQQKHNVRDVASLLSLLGDYMRRLDSITGCEEAIAALEEKIAALRDHAWKDAAQITKGRGKAAAQIAEHVVGTLAELGMPGVSFEVEITASDTLRATGADHLRFLFSANRNIAPAPVEKIASGGEISRVMLALKSLAAKSSNLPTIIFDEIDSGVSGRIADAMGNIIHELSQSMQVINITHLPQVASKGETHFYVYKDAGASSARTAIRLLSAQERVDEIAKMLSGSAITDAAVTQARLLLGM